jgi:dihydroorotate dehydrogenase
VRGVGCRFRAHQGTNNARTFSGFDFPDFAPLWGAVTALYENLLRPLLFRFDPETAHHLAIAWLRVAGPVARTILRAPSGPRLERTVFGVKFPNPVGLAAGMDKNAEVLPAWEALGFGFVEAGTITAKAQPGNPQPRVFRFPERGALINRMGFNNDGADAVAARLARLKESDSWPRIPVGLNIGKSKVTPLEEATGDYLYSFEKLFPFGDYFVLNVSSPNTPGLRKLQDCAALDELLGAIQRANRGKPVLLKIAPDLEFAQIEEIMELVGAHKLAGIVATNTTLDHSPIPEPRRQQGGLSGRPLTARATEIIRFIAQRTSLPIVGVGGIFDVTDAKEKLDAGAALVQLYTGFIYRGPMLAREICRGL